MGMRRLVKEDPGTTVQCLWLVICLWLEIILSVPPVHSVSQLSAPSIRVHQWSTKITTVLTAPRPFFSYLHRVCPLSWGRGGDWKTQVYQNLLLDWQKQYKISSSRWYQPSRQRSVCRSLSIENIHLPLLPPQRLNSFKPETRKCRDWGGNENLTISGLQFWKTS